MNVTIERSELQGRIKAIPSKSYAHRMLICAALSDSVCEIGCPDISADIAATAGCLKELCADVERTESGYHVTPKQAQKTAVIDCGESGSTFRFILPVACALGIDTELHLHGRLAERPMQPLYEALEANGAKISGKGSSVITVQGKLRAGEYRIPADVSSQFISGLMFALPLLDGDSRIILKGTLASAAYIEITKEVLREFQIVLGNTEDGYLIRGGQKYAAKSRMTVEGDWSNAAFWLCAAALGNEITCTGLNVNSAQGDKAVADILCRFGADVRISGDEVTVRKGELKGIGIDAEQIPDLVPVLAAVACAAEGETRFYNAARLRDKESDRITSTAETLRAMGADVTESEDGLTVRRSTLHGASVDSFGDHRIAMMAAVAAVSAEGPVTIENAKVVEKSYPSFFRDYAVLGGIVKEH